VPNRDSPSSEPPVSGTGSTNLRQTKRRRIESPTSESEVVPTGQTPSFVPQPDLQAPNAQPRVNGDDATSSTPAAIHGDHGFSNMENSGQTSPSQNERPPPPLLVSNTDVEMTDSSMSPVKQEKDTLIPTLNAPQANMTSTSVSGAVKAWKAETLQQPSPKLVPLTSTSTSSATRPQPRRQFSIRHLPLVYSECGDEMKCQLCSYGTLFTRSQLDD
jgi:hypothetical protein